MIVFCYIEIPDFFAKSDSQSVTQLNTAVSIPRKRGLFPVIQTPHVIKTNEVHTMKKLTLIFAAIALSFSATTALAMDGQADRYHEAQSCPNKSVEQVADVKVSAR